MRLIVGENIVIFLNNQYLKNIDLENKESIEKLVKRINNKYDIKLSGYYEINIYLDHTSGIILEIKEEQLEYIDYLNGEIEMNIQVVENSFLYKIEDIEKITSLKNKVILFKYLDSIYLKPINLSEIELGIVIENSEIIYGKKAETIIDKSKMLKEVII